MRNKISVKISGVRGAGKSRVLAQLVTCLDALGADVIWRDAAGSRVRRGMRIGQKVGPLNDIRVKLVTVDKV